MPQVDHFWIAVLKGIVWYPVLIPFHNVITIILLK